MRGRDSNVRLSRIEEVGVAKDQKWEEDYEVIRVGY